MQLGRYHGGGDPLRSVIGCINPNGLHYEQWTNKSYDGVGQSQRESLHFVGHFCNEDCLNERAKKVGTLPDVCKFTLAKFNPFFFNVSIAAHYPVHKERDGMAE